MGPVYQAGTLSGNPLAMAAGIAMLSYLKEHRKRVYTSLERMSADLANGIALAADGAGVAMTTNRVGAMFTWFFNDAAVTDFASAARSDLKRFAAFHQGMLEAGAWLPPSQYEAAFLGFAHTDEDIRQTVEAARKVLASIELHSQESKTVT
jgi:glutamate-1-semialdehyde 2,1-aminomutase